MTPFESVVAPPLRPLVPGVFLKGQVGEALNVESRDSLAPGVQWTDAGVVSLVTNAGWYFDLSASLMQRFYRSLTTNTETQTRLLSLYSVPALTLTGSMGDVVRVDGINRFGPIDAWFTLGTVRLTNTTQLYFDVTAPNSSARLYRLVAIP